MGSTKNNAGEEANRMEQQRQASVSRTQQAVNQVFDSPQREADIADFMSAMRTLDTKDLDRQKAATDRNLRFALARNGQVGGSTQIDQQREFADEYARGALEVERKAQGAGAELRASDQESRARLISLATSGMNATTGAQQAASAMRSNIESSKANMAAAGLGDVFSRFNKFYESSRESAERRRADRNAGWLYQPQGYGGKP